MKRSDAENLSPTQRTNIRHSDETDLALARKYGVSKNTIILVRETGTIAEKLISGTGPPYARVMATKKAAPKKRATKAKKAAPEPVPEPQKVEPAVLGGPALPRPLR